VKKLLRGKVAKLLKEHKLGALYVGSKLCAYRNLSAALLKTLLHQLQFKPGDLVHDCDGFNHRIKRFVKYRWWNGVIDIEVEFENGGRACGCNISPKPPRTREYIEECFKSMELTEVKEGDESWTWWNKKHQAALRQAVLRGEHVVDEDGILLPAFFAFSKSCPKCQGDGCVEDRSSKFSRYDTCPKCDGTRVIAR
jgi:hypothetical protein